MIFRDTSRSIAWSSGWELWTARNVLDVEGGEVREVGNYPTGERGQMLQSHISVLMFGASSIQKLVGIRYNCFLKCAFLQHYLFLKLL